MPTPVLQGLRVVEAATFVLGPAAGTVMADFGADVVHIEHPKTGDAYRYLHQLKPLPECERSYPWLLTSRNKRSVAVNLRAPFLLAQRVALADDALHGDSRVQRRVRVLENDLHVSPGFTQLLCAGFEHINGLLIVDSEQHFPGGLCQCRNRQQQQNGQQDLGC